MPDDPSRRQISAFMRTGIPHNKALGLEIREIGGGAATVEVPWSEALVGDPRHGLLHGGVVTTIVDVACGAAVFDALRAPMPVATLDLRVDNFRAAAARRPLICTARCVRVTRHVAFTRAVAHDGDEADPVAIGTGSFMLFRRGSKRSDGPRPTAAAEAPATTPPAVSPDEQAPAAALSPAPGQPERDDVLAWIERAREAGRAGDLVAAIPYSKFLGLRARMEGRRLVTSLAADRRNVGNPLLPALHGGVVGAMLESTAVFEVLASQPVSTLPRTVNLTIDYLRSAALAPTWAAAEIVRHGRRVATVRAHAWQSDEAQPIASAQVHLLLTR